MKSRFKYLFFKDEHGALTPFMLVLLIGTLAMAGFVLDLRRDRSERSDLQAALALLQQQSERPDRQNALDSDVLAALLALAAPARAEMVEDCNQEYDWDLKIGGCTSAIRSGQWQGEKLAAAYTNRGEAYGNLGDPARAIKDFDRALRLDPGDARAYYNRGFAYRKLGDTARAIEDYDRALQIDPGFAPAYNDRGFVYRNLGDPARAIENYDQALRIDPDDALVLNNRGFAYFNLGNPARAIEDYDQALRIDPAYAPAYNNRGFAYFNLGDPARAIEDYDQALRLDPGYAPAYNNRTSAHCKLGHVEASIDDRMEALHTGALTVEAMQSYLRHRGFYKSAIDGDFGPISRNALRAWTTAGCP